MTEQLIEPGKVQDSILAEYRKRINRDVLETLTEGTSLLRPSMGRTNYLRQLVRDSVGCNENFDALTAFCEQDTGAVFSRRASFRMGICLSILMAERIPRSFAPQPRVLRLGKREKQEQQQPRRDREAVAVET